MQARTMTATDALTWASPFSHPACSVDVRISGVHFLKVRKSQIRKLLGSFPLCQSAKRKYVNYQNEFEN
jgi:hypothetical protein